MWIIWKTMYREKRTQLNTNGHTRYMQALEMSLPVFFSEYSMFHHLIRQSLVRAVAFSKQHDSTDGPSTRITPSHLPVTGFPLLECPCCFVQSIAVITNHCQRNVAHSPGKKLVGRSTYLVGGLECYGTSQFLMGKLTIRLVVWKMTGLWLSIQLGMSSSQLTFIFFRGLGIPPTRHSVVAGEKKNSPWFQWFPNSRFSQIPSGNLT